MTIITDDWLGPISSEFKKPYYKELYKTVKHEYETKRVLPEPDGIFNAFASTPLTDVKAVILGQDPYHNYGQTHSLCFSVKSGVDIPPLLVNIYQELHDDLGCYIPNNGYLKEWADQGVMLLSTMFTVRAHQTNSHRGIGWKKFTDAAISVLNQQDRSMMFILWECPARTKRVMLSNLRHLALEALHPNPLSASRRFFGSRPFNKTSAFLVEHGLTPVGWQIENVQNRYRDRQEYIKYTAGRGPCSRIATRAGYRERQGVEPICGKENL